MGDGKYVTDGPRAGYVYMCGDFASSLGRAGIGGAKSRGPWFTPDGKGYRPADKPHVRGEVSVPGQFDVRIAGGTREISTNGLPQVHPVGNFPVALDDPVRAIDPNPNTIAERKVLYALPVSPAAASRPGCIREQVGVMLRSAALLSPVDAEGRDAVAWEVQDRCDGHPEPSGQYHFHGPSQCLPGTETARVIGYALDGFPITGSRDVRGREVFSRDLDQCHGGAAEYIDTDGRVVRGYRYALTRDWPYSVSCFTGGSESPLAPGRQSNPTGPAAGTADGTGFTLPAADHPH
ncbi:hypothetical protein AXK58_14305 [Tsukamurella tyrosinosolvens]|nr:hypothetical protein AXK58_14305 [Tsukamurella tyrosinosolvens]